MKKYTIGEIADEIGVTRQQINSKVKRKSFPKEYITKTVNMQNREVLAVTEEGRKLLRDEYNVTDETVNAEDKALLGQLKLVKQGEFLWTTCDFYEDEQNNIYMTREQIGKALEYSDDVQVRKLHYNNQKLLDPLSVEITRFDTRTLQRYDLSNPDSKPLSNLQPNTLLYNEDGIYEITFLSRQPKANEFRRSITYVKLTYLFHRQFYGRG